MNKTVRIVGFLFLLVVAISISSGLYKPSGEFIQGAVVLVPLGLFVAWLTTRSGQGALKLKVRDSVQLVCLYPTASSDLDWDKIGHALKRDFPKGATTAIADYISMTLKEAGFFLNEVLCIESLDANHDGSHDAIRAIARGRVAIIPTLLAPQMLKRIGS